MEPFLARVAAGPTIIGDGALGTSLMARGLRVQDCLESAVLSRPELIEEIAAGYLAAGSEVLTTDSFGASPLKLDAYGLAGRTEELNRRAVELLRGVAGNRAWIAGSVGPTGRILTPYGDTEPAEVAAAFERQVGALAEAGADLIIVETMIDLAEARLAVAAAKRLAPAIPVVATMTFDATPRGFFTTMGTTIAQAAAGLADAGADLVGSNCGNGIEAMVAIGLEFSRSTRCRSRSRATPACRSSPPECCTGRRRPITSWSMRGRSSSCRSRCSAAAAAPDRTTSARCDVWSTTRQAAPRADRIHLRCHVSQSCELSATTSVTMHE